MSGVETQQPTSGEGEHDLDEWFVRRLEQQGIPAHTNRPPANRVIAVASIAVAALGLFWAFSASGSHGTTSSPPASTPSTKASSTPTNTGNNGKSGGTKTAIVWNTIPIDVLNGYGGSGAAAAAETQLNTQGWRVANTGDAGTETTETVVVYAPGFLKQARVVATRMHLGAPVALADAPGVPSNATAGVAVVLGPNGLG
jgi:hypothetical protein